MTEEGTYLQPAAREFGIAAETDHSVIKQLLIDRINELLRDNFHQLISILYRLDINESKLKALLKENPGIDAALIITDLIIERELQKIKSRKENKGGGHIPENEKW